MSATQKRGRSPRRRATILAVSVAVLAIVAITAASTVGRAVQTAVVGRAVQTAVGVALLDAHLHVEAVEQDINLSQFLHRIKGLGRHR